jgi:flagella basal body P-ring formation protein FlgA
MHRLPPVTILLLAVLAMGGRPALPAAAAADSALAATPLTQESFLAGLGRDLAAHFNFEGDLQLELLRPWPLPARLAARWTVTVTEYPAVAAPSMLVRCRVFADGTSVAEGTLMLRATLWREAWTAKEPLTVGATFDPATLETRRVDLLRERDALPTSVGDRSFIFARTLPAGRLLTWRDITRRPLVRKGDLVEVSATEGQLAVTMKAQAMENGAQGDAVTVRNLDSKKNFTAFVVDENRVQVRF